MKPRASVAMPALSRPRSSVFGRRPTAASRWLPSIASALPAGVDDDAHAAAVRALATAASLHREVERDALALEDRAGSRPRPRGPRARSAGRRARARSRASRSAGTSARTRGRCSCRRRSPGARAGSRPPSSRCWSAPARRSMPGQSAATGRPPTLMKIFGASSDLAVHLDRVRPDEARMAADERSGSACRRASSSRPSTDSRTTASLRAFTAFMSTLTGAVDAHAVVGRRAARRGRRGRSRPASWSGCSRR